MPNRKRTFNVARPKIFRPPDFAATMTTPVRVAGSSDLIRPLYSMSAPPDLLELVPRYHGVPASGDPPTIADVIADLHTDLDHFASWTTAVTTPRLRESC